MTNAAYLPLVTISTPMYNTGAEVVETIDSIRRSTYPNIEHIIIDDASTDDSVARVREHLAKTGHPAKLVVHEQNQGIAKTRQHGLDLAQGKYLVGVADDLMRPDRIEQDVAHLEALGDAVVGVFSIAQTFVHGTGEVLGRKGAWEGEVLEHGLVPREALAARLLESNFIAAMTCTLRRATLLEVGYDTRFFVEDYPMWVRLLKAGYAFAYRPEVSMDYRITEKSVRKRYASRVALDVVRSKALFLGSGLVPDPLVRQKTWHYFWGQITHLTLPHRKEALASLRALRAPIGYGLWTAVRYFAGRIGVWTGMTKRNDAETVAMTVRKR